MLLLIDLGHLCNEVGGDPVLEFLHGVDSGCLEKFGELRTDALDAEEICMVYPCEDELAGNAGCLLKFLAALGSLSPFKELVNCFNACGDEFLGIDRSYALNVDNLVSHCDKIFEMNNKVLLSKYNQNL